MTLKSGSWAGKSPITRHKMPSDFKTTRFPHSRNELLIELLRKKPGSEDGSVAKNSGESKKKLNSSTRMDSSAVEVSSMSSTPNISSSQRTAISSNTKTLTLTECGKADLVLTPAQKQLHQQLLQKHRYLREIMSKQQEQFELVAKQLQWVQKNSKSDLGTPPESAKESTASFPSTGTDHQGSQSKCNELQSLKPSEGPTTKEPTLVLPSVSTDNQYSTSTCSDQPKAPQPFQELPVATGARQRDGDNDLPSQKRFRSEQQHQPHQQQQQQQQQQHHQQQQQQKQQQQQQQTHREHQQDSPLKYWSDPGPQLLDNNTVPPPQAGFRNAQQQQQQDSQLTQPLPLSCQPRRTSSTGLASTGASSPMHLTLPTLSFEPSMAASMNSATQDLRLANEILRLQLLQQQLLNQIQCQQQQQTNSFANFSSMSFTQALLDDQVPMATCEMPSNATDQIQDLCGFGFMDHVFGNDLSELDCVQHAAEFGGGYSSSTSNIYCQDGGLNNAK